MGSPRRPRPARASRPAVPATGRTPVAGQPTPAWMASCHRPPPAVNRQVVVDDRKPSTQVLAVPLQESVPSQAPPVDSPVQVVVAEANPSTGQAPDVPLQLSATSH